MPDRLYKRLPALYRRRDDGSLRALLALLEEELERVEARSAERYDDAFVETCAEELLPRIGALLGLRGRWATGEDAPSLRPWVANALAQARRKGTAAGLEQLARDLTGATADLVEQRNQCSRHVHLAEEQHGPRLLHLSYARQLERLGSTRDLAARLPDTRCGRGPHPYGVSVDLHVLRAMRVTGVNPGQPQPFEAPQLLSVDPAGRSAPLIHAPEPEWDLDSLAEPWHLPLRISRVALRAEPRFRANFTLRLLGADGAWHALPGVELRPAKLDHLPYGWRPDSGVALDPELGRFVISKASLTAYGLPTDNTDIRHRLRIDATLGRIAPLGAHPLDRSASVRRLAAGLERPWVAEVGPELSLGAAVKRWNAHSKVSSGAHGLLFIPDSLSHVDPRLTLRVELRRGDRLLIAAARRIGPLEDGLDVGDLAADRLRPCIAGNLRVTSVSRTGESAAHSAPGELRLEGLLLSGAVQLDGELNLHARHCSFVRGLLLADLTRPGVPTQSLRLERCLSGPLHAKGIAGTLRLQSCVLVHPSGEQVLSAPTLSLQAEACSFLGRVSASQATAEDCIFEGRLSVERPQAGGLRRCAFPASSQHPRAESCTQDAPRFASRELTAPDLAWLLEQSPASIRTGAGQGRSMGAWRERALPPRLADLRDAIDEHLRVGLHAALNVTH